MKLMHFPSMCFSKLNHGIVVSTQQKLIYILPGHVAPFTQFFFVTSHGGQLVAQNNQSVVITGS